MSNIKSNKRTRAILKSYFKTGECPSEYDFCDLIDSSLNLVEDGVFVNKDKQLAIGHCTHKNTLDVHGNAAIGSQYAGNFSAPPDGLLVEGAVGIGTHNIASERDLILKVNGNALLQQRLGVGFNNWDDDDQASLKVSGDTVLDGKVSVVEGNDLEVAGSVKAKVFIGDGSQLSGVHDGKWTQAADGDLYFEDGNVGIGTDEPTANLTLGAASGYYSKEDNIQLQLAGRLNKSPNKTPGERSYKLLIEGYDNDGSIVYPAYFQDENGNVDFWVKNRPDLKGIPSMYFAGNFGIGDNYPEEALVVDGNAIIKGNLSLHGKIQQEAEIVAELHKDFKPDGARQKPTYYLGANGRVYLSGRVKRKANASPGTPDAKVFILDTKHRPERACRFVVAAQGTGTRNIEVLPNGHVNVLGTIDPNEEFSLDGISFFADLKP